MGELMTLDYLFLSLSETNSSERNRAKQENNNINIKEYMLLLPSPKNKSTHIPDIFEGVYPRIFNLAIKLVDEFLAGMRFTTSEAFLGTTSSSST